MLAMTAFAANSLLCRQALRQLQIDAASFTAIRILSGAAVLWLLLHLNRKTISASGNWISALALFSYMAAFSFSYVDLSAGTGALLLFGAVQTTMILYGLWSGERLGRRQVLGLLMAVTGLVIFLLPGISPPPLMGATLMLAAGVCWGIYSLRGKGSKNPLAMTAGNFLRSVPMTIALSIFMLPQLQMQVPGVVLAVLSGAIASGLGYAIWYQVVRDIKTTSAAIMQLSVPIIAAVGGMMLLEEAVTWHFVLSSAIILGGIALAILRNENGRTPK